MALWGYFKRKGKLQRPDSALSELFTDAPLREWRKSISRAAPDFDPSSEFRQMADKVILPGDSRNACKGRRKALAAHLKPIGSPLSVYLFVNYFISFSGED